MGVDKTPNPCYNKYNKRDREVNTMKKTCTFEARSNRKGYHFQLCVKGNMTYDSNDFPTKTALVQGIKEYFSEDWSRGSFTYRPDQIVVKTGIRLK